MSFTPSDNHVLGRYMGNDTPPTPSEIELTRLLAVSALVTKLERICSSGVLSEDDEMHSRQIIVAAAKAFKFDTMAERPIANVVNFPADDYDRTVEAVSREMGT